MKPSISLMLLIVSAGAMWHGALAQTSQDPAPLTDREKMLLDRIDKLERRVAVLEVAQNQSTSPAQRRRSSAAPPATACRFQDSWPARHLTSCSTVITSTTSTALSAG